MATIANRFHLPSLMYGITDSCGLFVQGVLFPVVLFLSRNQPPVCSHGDHCKQVSFTFPHVGAFCHPYATPSVLSPGLLPTIQFLITHSERKWKRKAWEHSLREWCQFLLRSTEEGRRRLWTSFMQVFFFLDRNCKRKPQDCFLCQGPSPPPLSIQVEIDTIHMFNTSKPSPSVFTFCEQSRTGWWKRLWGYCINLLWLCILPMISGSCIYTLHLAALLLYLASFRISSLHHFSPLCKQDGRLSSPS